jgi:hypothetical protein
MRKILTVLLALSLLGAMAFCGCSQGKDSTPKGNTQQEDDGWLDKYY